MIRNMYLQEAVSNTFNVNTYVAAYKKLLNLCALTKFRSTEECGRFFLGFFCSTVETENKEPLTFDQWNQIYTTLLNDDKFCNSLCQFMTMYQPTEYTGMWVPVINQIDSELQHMEKYRIRYLSDCKVFFKFVQRTMDSIGETIKVQINDPNVIKFITSVNGALQSHIIYMDTLLKREAKAQGADEISHIVMTPLAEDVQEILSLLENYDSEIEKIKKSFPMNEAIVKSAVMKAKEIHIAEQKAGRAFDEFIMKKVKVAREKRRNRKHAEMVGEALRINNELKRLLKSCAIGVFSPAFGVITWVISVVIDRKTDARDRQILVGQIKDELEIVEEKIQQAERNGDDKGKIELIRIRQRLNKEYERIQKYRYEPK